MYKFDILEMDNNGLSIKKTGEKIVYSIDNGEKLSDWVRKELLQIPSQNKGVRPHLSSALKVSESSHQKDVMDGFLGSYIGLSNSVEENGSGVILGSSTMTRGNAKVSLSVIDSNFFKIMCAFTSRRLIVKTWKNNKDEYFAPNENHDSFENFKYDSLIYSLFNSASNQSSLRQITYKDQLWDIKNNFFWMSKNEMTELANQNNYNELYNDVRTDSDRYVHTLLFGEEGIYDQLSDEAKDVLDSATNLVRLSFGMRRNFADDTNHLNSWDAGYAQLKLIWKEYYPEQFKEFRAKYKVLEDKMRPMVYELGFLVK
jgi:hypothetical protein